MAEITSVERIIHHMCDPHVTTELGEGLTYQKFITYVKTHLAPYMEMDFVEEVYYEEVFNEIRDNQKTLQELPRGHSKTELVGIWLTIYFADYQPLNPWYLKYKGKEKRIIQQLLIAGSGDDLEVWTLRIKEFFYRSAALKRIAPLGANKDKSTKRWNNKIIMLSNGSVVHFRSMKGKIRGLHVDRVAGDDIITESSTLTDKVSINIWDGAVDGTTTAKEALTNMTGTPLRNTDILAHIRKKTESYYCTKKPAIIDEIKKIVLSPKRRNYDDLMRTKKRIGPTKFSREYMLTEIDDNISLIKAKHIIGCYDPLFEGLWLKVDIQKTGKVIDVTFTPKNKVEYKRSDWEKVFGTMDFAFSDTDVANYTVLSFYGLKFGRIYKIGYIRGKGWSTPEQFAILEKAKEYLGVDLFGLEENSIRGYTKNIRDFNFNAVLFWMGSSDTAAKIKPDSDFAGKRCSISKTLSIERLDTAYYQQKFILPYKTELDQHYTDLQKQESVSWALENGKLIELGGHPDIPITDILMNEMFEKPTAKTEFASINSGVGGSIQDDNDEDRSMVEVQGIDGE